ncbi:ATP synthase subunit I [Aliidiomarina sp. Khilg15.8]
MQFSVAAALVCLFWVFAGAPSALSAAAGGIIGLVPNSIFAVLAFRFGGARSALSVVNSFMAGEALKLMLSVVLLVVALNVLSGPLLPLFAVFALLHLLHLLAPILLLKTN